MKPDLGGQSSKGSSSKGSSSRQTCASVRRQLTSFVGGDLDRERGAAVAGHLADCPACRRDASSLQQARKALIALRGSTPAGSTPAGSTPAGSTSVGSVPAGTDPAMLESLHESLHRDTIAAVERQMALEGERYRLPLLARALGLAAAVMLFGLGWWSQFEPQTPTLLDREPISPAGMADADSDPLVLPWAGDRAILLPLSEDDHSSGMLDRWRFRALVEDEVEGEFDYKPRRRGVSGASGSSRGNERGTRGK